MLYADVNEAIKTTRDPGGLIGLMVCLVVASFFRTLAALIEQVAAGKLLPAPMRVKRTVPPRRAPQAPAASGPAPAPDFTQLPPPVDDAAARALNRAFAYLNASRPAAPASNPAPFLPRHGSGIARPSLVCIAVNPDPNQNPIPNPNPNRVMPGLDLGTSQARAQCRLPLSAITHPTLVTAYKSPPKFSKRRFRLTYFCTHFVTVSFHSGEAHNVAST